MSVSSRNKLVNKEKEKGGGKGKERRDLFVLRHSREKKEGEKGKHKFFRYEEKGKRWGGGKKGGNEFPLCDAKRRRGKGKGEK